MAANPNPALITDASWWLMQQLQALQPGTLNGGIYDDKPGYHNTRARNKPDNYSVRDAVDQGGPPDKAAAYDWTFPDAQAGRYATIAKYSSRLLAAGRDPEDHRLDGWREFFGQADSDTDVEGWDFRENEAATSNKSHLWHIHLSENRNQVESMDNKRALLSVLRGESRDQAETGDDTMMYLVQVKDKAAIFVGDMISRRWVRDPEDHGNLLLQAKNGLIRLWDNGNSVFAVPSRERLNDWGVLVGEAPPADTF